MDFKKFLEQNELTESELTKEEVWQAGQRQLISDFLAGYTNFVCSDDELDQIINKIYERT